MEGDRTFFSETKNSSGSDRSNRFVCIVCISRIYLDLKVDRISTENLRTRTFDIVQSIKSFDFQVRNFSNTVSNALTTKLVSQFSVNNFLVPSI